MSTKLVFFLVGARRRVGKGTFAAMLCDVIRRRGDIAIPMSFAGALRDELNYALKELEWPDAADAWTEEPGLKESVIRPLLIAWGNGRRYFNEHHWVDRVLVGANSRRELHKRSRAMVGQEGDKYLFIVVSDWRFPNEIVRLCAAARQSGDHVVGIHLSRKDAPEGTPDEQFNDPLCRALADTRIKNDGDPESLRECAFAILDTFHYQQNNPPAP